MCQTYIGINFSPGCFCCTQELQKSAVQDSNHITRRQKTQIKVIIKKHRGCVIFSCLKCDLNNSCSRIQKLPYNFVIHKRLHCMLHLECWSYNFKIIIRRLREIPTFSPIHIIYFLSLISNVPKNKEYRRYYSSYFLDKYINQNLFIIELMTTFPLFVLNLVIIIIIIFFYLKAV